MKLIEKIKHQIDYAYCSFAMICQKHRIPLSMWGEKKVYCGVCEEEKGGDLHD